MGFDIVLGPLEGINERYEESWPFFDHCLAKFEAVNQHLASLGLPPYVEPRPPDDGYSLLGSGRQVIEFMLDVIGISDEVEERFDQIAIAGVGSLFLPVALPAPVRLDLPDGDSFAVGSAGALLMQCLYLLKLQDQESIFMLDEGLQRAREQGYQPLPDIPGDLQSELAEVDLGGADTLCGAAVGSLTMGLSIYIF
ncbi:hypothetical protein [Kribbella sp. NPDC006257]|uniref:hypothetical protein n=1 Tax=Kribbella sp. NPDC006257 TaxID=3156738 RepID=UPI0033A2314F